MKNQSLPPGPQGLPLLGTLPALYRDVLAWMLDLGLNYGTISFARVGPLPVYSLNDPQLIEEVLVGKHRECVKDASTRELGLLVGKGLLTAEGDAWRKQRRLAAPPLQTKRIASYADAMVACTQRALAGFAPDGVRDIYLDMVGLTLEIVGKTLLGFDTRSDTARVSHFMDVAMDYYAKRWYTWRGLLPPWLPSLRRRALLKAVADLDRMVAALIARCRAETPEPDHLLARLAHARDDNGEALSDAQLRDEAVTMLLAGHETTALTLTYALYLLAKHPQAAACAREEVDRVLADRAGMAGDISSLQYLDAVVRETLRLYPPAYTVGRQVATPFEAGGYTFPRGAQLLMSPYSVQRNPNLYEAPHDFRPERWLEAGRKPMHRFAYFPFGGGPRVCIGNHFAMMEAVLVLATIMQDQAFAALPEFELRLDPAVTLRPARGGVHVHLRRRERVMASHAAGSTAPTIP